MDKFLKCDLHVHSSSCFSRNYSENDFLAKLKKSNLDVISITDHNIVDTELYSKIMNDTSITVKLIGGVELNVSLDPDTIKRCNLQTKGDYFHAIIWFDVKNASTFWDLLQELIIGIDESIIKSSSKNVKKISEQMDQRHISLKAIQEKFNNMDYYFTFHENKGDRNLSDYLPNFYKETGEQLQTNQLYKESLFFYNNAMSVEGGEKSKKIKKYFEKNLDTLVATFLFSDAINLDDIGKKYTWINFDGDFNSLILPISDPRSRVFTSDHYAENPQKNKNNYLQGIKLFLKEFDGSESEKTILFSPGLNGIIGARGDGKSMLGNIIARDDALIYKEFVNHENIEYLLPDGSTTRNKPRCKYLKQKDLFQIYENKEFDKLDLLKRYYDDLIKENDEVVKESLDKIKNIFSELQNVILRFFEKYQGQTISFIALKKEIQPNKLLPNINASLIENSKESLDALHDFISDNIRNWNKENELIKSNSFDSVYPELSPLVKSKKGVDKIVITQNKQRIKKAQELLNEISTQLPISEIRLKLVKIFQNNIDVINKDFDYSSTQYITEIEKLKNFYIDFLNARLKCKECISKINIAYNEISTVNKSKTINFEDHEIKVAIEMECKLSFNEVLQPFILNAVFRPDILILFLLEAENFDNINSKIKKPRFKNIYGFTDFINNLFSQIFDEVKKNKNQYCACFMMALTFVNCHQEDDQRYYCEFY